MRRARRSRHGGVLDGELLGAEQVQQGKAAVRGGQRSMVAASSGAVESGDEAVFVHELAFLFPQTVIVHFLQLYTKQIKQFD